MQVDLNADMGEGFGQWTMGNDHDLLDIISSANIACGFHAGDPDIMIKTIVSATKRGVGVGAHPGFDDLQGFGRRRLNIPIETVQNQIRYQIGAFSAMALAADAEMKHVKLHGALSNMCAEDYILAKACIKAILSVAPKTKILVLAATQLQQAAIDLNANWVSEIFADRAYNDDATLVDRTLPNAVIHNPEIAAARMVEMIKAGAIISQSGKHIPAQIDSICLHGDTPAAVEIAKCVKQSLTKENITIKSL